MRVNQGNVEAIEGGRRVEVYKIGASENKLKDNIITVLL